MSEITNSSRATAQLSKLQKCILKEGLRAYWWIAPIRRAWAGGSLEPAAFNSAPVLIDFYSLSKEEVNRFSKWRKEARKPGGKLARARIAIYRATKSLIGRGLLEPTSVRGGLWQLTALGKGVAAGLWPELKRPARRDLLPKIKEAYLDRIKRGRLAPGTDFKSFVRNCFRPG